MKPGRMLQVVTNKQGTIVGVARLPEGFMPDNVQVRVSPLPGQSAIELPVTDDLGRLETVEDFRRLAAEFHLPRGAKALARKPVARKGARKTR